MGAGPQAMDDMRRALVSHRFPASNAAVRETLLQIDAALCAADVDADLRTRAQIALAEACNNIVEHAYGPLDPSGAQMIRVDIAGDQDGLHITLRDQGRAMPDGPLPGCRLPPLDPKNPHTLPEGGFGWALLRKMTRALSTTRHDGQNILQFQLPHGDRSGRSGQNDT